MKSLIDADTLMAIGRIGAPKGVRGDLKIHSYSGEFSHFLDIKEALLEGELPAAPKASAAAPNAPAAAPAAAPANVAPKRRMKLRVLRAEASEGGLTMAFAGYESPEAARKLTGLDIMAPRSRAAPLGENEWYVADLIGLALVAEGRKLATVESVLDGGPEPWLEARLPGGGTAVVPFRKEFVGEVDLDEGRITVLAPWILE